MNKVLIFALTVYFFLSETLSSPTNFSYNRKNNERIVNGWPLSLGEAPYQISLRYVTDHFCGGSILSQRYVLTAAHCLGETSDNVQNYEVAAGFTTLTADDGVKAGASAFILHGDFQSQTFVNDVAIIYLSSDLPVGSQYFTGQIALPPLQLAGTPDSYVETSYENYPNDPDIDSLGTVFIVSGWGTTQYGDTEPLSNELLATNIAYVPDETCQDGNGNPNAGYGQGNIVESMICGGGIGGNHDSCQGDSGGPVVMEGSQTYPFETLTNEQIGIVSWGYGCANDGFPGVFTQVSFFRQWILDAMDCFPGHDIGLCT